MKTNSAAVYVVMTGEGGELAAQMTLARARARAKELAQDRGESVWVCGPGLGGASDEAIGEEVRCARNPEANALLIAAAPDLLAALDAICEWDAEVGTGNAGLTERIAAARAAIAKARGE